MKISNKQFAIALLESVRDKKKKEIKDVLKNFVYLLRKENALTRADQILSEFVKLFNQENGIVLANVKCTSSLDKACRKQVETYIKELAGGNTIELSEEEDKAVLGGLVIRYGDKIIDSSLKTRLNKLREELKK